MFLVNMELADRIEESAEAMVAAETAPKAINVTADGVKYCRTRGSTRLASCVRRVPFGVSLL